MMSGSQLTIVCPDCRSDWRHPSALSRLTEGTAVRGGRLSVTGETEALASLTIAEDPSPLAIAGRPADLSTNQAETPVSQRSLFVAPRSDATFDLPLPHSAPWDPREMLPHSPVLRSAIPARAATVYTRTPDFARQATDATAGEPQATRPSILPGLPPSGRRRQGA
jgi:hypothetical protein